MSYRPTTLAQHSTILQLIINFIMADLIILSINQQFGVLATGLYGIMEKHVLRIREGSLIIIDFSRICHQREMLNGKRSSKQQRL